MRWCAPGSAVIVGSIRHIADILTVPPKFFPQMRGHPKTDGAVQQFVTEFQKWQAKPAVLPLSKSA